MWLSLAHPKVATLKRLRLVTKFNSLFLTIFLLVRSRFPTRSRICFCPNYSIRSKVMKLHAWLTLCQHSNLNTPKMPWLQVIHLKLQSCPKVKTSALCSLSIDQDQWAAAESRLPKRPSNYLFNLCLSVPNSLFWVSAQHTGTNRPETEIIFGITTIKPWTKSWLRSVKYLPTLVAPIF